MATDPRSQELQRTISSLAFLQLCLPRCGTVGRCFSLPRLRLVSPRDSGNPRTDPRNAVEQRPEKRSDRCCHMCTQVLRTDLHAQNVSPERFRTVQPAFFCVNVCVRFRVNFRQLFAFLCFEISDRFRCSDAGLTFYLGLGTASRVLTNRSEELWQPNCMPLNRSEPFRRHWNHAPEPF